MNKQNSISSIPPSIPDIKETWNGAKMEIVGNAIAFGVCAGFFLKSIFSGNVISAGLSGGMALLFGKAVLSNYLGYKNYKNNLRHNTP